MIIGKYKNKYELVKLWFLLFISKANFNYLR